jgi:hypothetical protein
MKPPCDSHIDNTRHSRKFLHSVWHAICEREVCPQPGSFQRPVGDSRVAHQRQGATLLSSEFIRLEQRGQSGRSEELHTIEVHNHDARNLQLRNEKVGQFQPTRSVDLTYYRDYPGIGSVLGHPQTKVSGNVAAYLHTRHNILRKTG